MANSKKDASGSSGSLTLVGLEAEEERPEISIHALDRSDRVLASAEVDAEGRFSLSPKALKAAHRIVLGPAEEEPEALGAEAAVTFWGEDIRARIAAKRAIEIGRTDWSRFLLLRQCVSGSVSRCRPFRWLFEDLQFQRLRLGTSLFGTVDPRERARLDDALIAAPGVSMPITARRCEPVCDGVIDVYRRTCCCRDLVIDDSRIRELIEKLKRIPFKPPRIVWPPPPDPPPFRLPIESGVLDEAALHAELDAIRIEELSGSERVEYVRERPYLRRLWCSCGAAEHAAQGTIRPDGTFQICWRQPGWSTRAGCQDEYAFVIKQAVDEQIVTIYDGVAVGRWFDETSGIELVSYDPRARGCHRSAASDEPIALLEAIGTSGSFQLKTPDASGPESVEPPAYNDGLLNPAASEEDARGKYANQNFGGTLNLLYRFGEALKGLGAVYYRLSVARADDNGNPLGPRKALKAALAWIYYEGIETASESLGPNTVNGEANLYRIPYFDDHTWHTNQYHGSLVTTGFEHGRHLLTLEIFDEQGRRLRPDDSSGAGIPTPFTYRRQYQEIGLTAEVKFAALTHMLWWDNRQAEAEILDLRADGAPSSAECQFLTRPGTATFSVGYRAYHLNPLFILNHVIWWRRGLGGPSGVLVRSDLNAGMPLAPIAVTDPNAGTPPATFDNMLGTQTKCSFALNLHVNVKTTDGARVLTELGNSRQAAFALERAP